MKDTEILFGIIIDTKTKKVYGDTTYYDLIGLKALDLLTSSLSNVDSLIINNYAVNGIIINLLD